MAHKVKRKGLFSKLVPFYDKFVFSETNKENLKQYNKHVYEPWLLSNSEKLSLPSVPKIMWLSASSRENVFCKTSLAGYSPDPKYQDHEVSFIARNGKPNGFIWRTSAENLRQAVRWGIIPTESVTSKVIGVLGHYRVIEHERVIKGLISNTHRPKLELLDHYQDRFEALQELESLVNQNDIDGLPALYEKKFEAYIKKLKAIQASVKLHLSRNVQSQLAKDIEDDITRAKNYLKEVQHAKNTKSALKKFNRARGNASILEFVKRQMTHGLYEMQGINLDITYDRNRHFAFTRGALNDCIEDARKVLDDHRPDPRNLVLPEHHGIFGTGDEPVVYDFKKDHLTPEREREVVGAISFIQKWDEVQYNENDEPELHVFCRGARTSRPLTVTTSPNWRSSVSLTVFCKKMGWILANTFLSIIGKTQTVDENGFFDKNGKQEKDWRGKYIFRTCASMLRRSSYVRTYKENSPWYTKLYKLIFPGTVKYHGARPNESLLIKLWNFCKKLGGAGANVAIGFGEFIASLIDKLPVDIYYDYMAGAKKLPELKRVKEQAQEQIDDIDHDFALYLHGYKLAYMPPTDITLQRNTLYLHEKFSDDKKKSWLEYKVIDPTGNVVNGILTSPQLDGSIWDFPTRGNEDDLQRAFRNILPTMVEVLSDRGHMHNCYGVNELIRNKYPGDKDTFQTYKASTAAKYVPRAKLARMPNRLSPGDENDIVTAIVRGGDGFVSFFTHNFGKDPLGALVFGTGYSLVGGSIYLPNAFSFLGSAFEGWAQSLGLSMASGSASSAVAGACMVGQWGWGMVDFIEHGPQSGLVKTIRLVMDDPLTLGAGVGAAWLAGHVLTISIPVLGNDLGTNEDIDKLTIGIKSTIALHEAFHKAQQNPGTPIKFTVGDVELVVSAEALTPAQKEQNERFKFVNWLIERYERLPQLSVGVRHKLARQVDLYFKDDKVKATALKQLIFPKRSYSIAHQLVTIPLSYFPALFRFVASFVSVAVIYFKTGQVTKTPINIAGNALSKKILKDLTRLLVASEGLVHLMGNIVAAVVKIPVLLVVLPVCRVMSLFGVNLGHDIFKWMAEPHIAWRQLGEILFPQRALKHMADEHPVSAVERVHSSQKKMFEGLGVEVGKKGEPPQKPSDQSRARQQAVQKQRLSQEVVISQVITSDAFVPLADARGSDDETSEVTATLRR